MDAWTPYIGEWIATDEDGNVLDHDLDLEALGTRLIAGGVQNERLFRVGSPQDPATAGYS